MLKGITFKGKHSSELGIVVNSVKRSLLPPLEAKTIKIPNRPGEYFFGTEKGMRIFQVTMTLVIRESSYVWDMAHDINAWLFSKDEEELTFDQEPDITYYAFVSGDSALEKSYNYGTFVITFICPDPHGYGPEIETASLLTSPTNVTVQGQEETHPVIVATFTQPSTFFTVATKHNHVHVGSAAGVDEITVPKEEKKLNDNMSSTSGWITHSAVDGGMVTGSFISDGYVFKPNSYGTGSTWHGPCLKKTVATPIQDFKLEATVNLSSLSQKEMGRVEIYLLDQNGAVVGKVGAKDIWGDERTMVEVRAGNLATGKNLVAYIGNVVKKTKKVTTKKKVKGKLKDVTSIVTEGFSTYADFYGTIRVTRVGNVWDAYVGKVDTKTGKHHTRLSVKWTDKFNAYNTQVAGIAVHVGQYGTNPFMNVCRIHHVTLTKINTVTSFDVPEILDAGDELTIDCETGAVLKNGEPMLEELHISSEFFPLKPGINNIAFEPDDKCDIQVFHRGKYI